MKILRNRTFLWSTLALLLQAAAFYGFSRGENAPSIAPLSLFVKQAGSWEMREEGVVEKDVQEVLRADDTLTRVYVNQASQDAASLFIAFFRSQRAGQAPHSPKNCLPGAGWAPSESGLLTVEVPGTGTVTVNKYLVAKGEQRSLVVYWYQSRHRTIASEYIAKIYLVADAIRYNRTDTALVRVTIPVRTNVENAQTAVVDFIRTFNGPLRRHLPS